ncbi:MAG: hypothetical protein KDD51_15095 [Bdellovibrionales bacterium]|nr:hypothetical protein [Bdellovibrionales bacterium]
MSRPIVLLPFFIAVCMTAAVYPVVAQWLFPPLETPIRYLVARYDLAEGHLLQLSDFKLATGIRDEHGAISDQELHLIKGARLRAQLSANRVLRQAHLLLSASVTGLARSVPRGYRAYQIMLSERIFVGAGDFVDVVSAPADFLPPEIVAESLEVLQVRTGREMSVLVVAVHRNEIGKLEMAQQRGKLSIALRNPQDHIRVAEQRHKKRKPRPTIEVLAED